MRSRALNLAALALLIGLGASSGAAMRPAAGQQLDAGKPPSQIFAGTCAACHRSPRGLVRSVSPGSLPSFLRQHYTTGSDMAGTMAAYVLGNGGTQQVAEPPAKREPKQEPKQRGKSDGQDVAARTPEPKEQPKAAKQKAGKKGAPEPAAKDAPQEPEKPEIAKPESPKPEVAKPESSPAEPTKPETAAVDCKVEPGKQDDDGKPGFAMPPATPPRQPAALLTLPGFPAPSPEPEPEPAASAGCEPVANTATAARTDTAVTEPAPEQLQKEQAGEQAKEPAKDQPKEQIREQPKEQAAPAASPPTFAEAPRSERATATLADKPPSLDIMREEVHAPARPVRQKKRAPPATP